ncbi:MAG: Insulinase (Peptidase M16) [Thelocarpon superellum]|nr:MAG: Insulinase (Peptidase M16) [Thelocarpon superellum]
MSAAPPSGFSRGLHQHELRTASSSERLADHLEKPSLDDRSYRVIRLPNKLEALLVHDGETDKASAALDVNVGNFSDKSDMPGMAHAVEHLLFMGTEKYPVENAYSQYLTSHSGYSNAYTASTSTNYYFEVAASAGTDTTTHGAADAPSANLADSPLYGALDRFAQFFIAPLFLSSTLDRELKAVDSENKKNLQSDTWRLNQLNKSLSNPKHPYCHFSTGNLETLRDAPKQRGIDVRAEFIQFHEAHYSANRMKLVVLGREPLDVLQQWVEELFAGVRNKDLPQNRWDDEQPLTKRELLMQYFAKPVMDSRELDIYFPFLDEENLFETQPSRYLAHLIGHEGPGSILALIKAKGWANGLGAGSMPVCPGSALFGISIRLTVDGLKHYKEIVKIVFHYISLLKLTPPQEWIVEEMKGMAEVDFRFKQKSPASKFTSRISSVMQKPLPRELLLSGLSLIRRFDADLITQALSYLRADNFRLSIVSQDLSDGLDQKERWYGTEYRNEQIPADFLEEIQRVADGHCRSDLPELYLPGKNEFIPTKLEVEKKEVAEPLKAPRLIRNDEGVRIWWKKDDRFWVPKGNVWITLRNPLVNATPENAVKTKLYCELVNDALVEYSYDAELAGLNYGLSSDSLGLDVDVSGYNDKMPVLLEKVLGSMRDLEVKPDRFKVVKERLLRAYRNWDFQQPYQQVGEFTRWLNNERGWTNEQCLAELPRLTVQDIQEFHPQLLRQVHVEALAHGNLYKEDALRLSRLVETTLKPRPLPPSQWTIERSLILPPASDFTYQRTLKDPANVNHCIEYFLFIGDCADRALRARLLLFAQTTDEPAFDQLRTKEQLGYIVFTGPRMQATTMGYRVLIQSERTTEYLETRIDAFLQGFAKVLADMTPEAFEGHKRSLINKRREKLKNLGQESQRFWSHIGTEYFDFEQVDHDVANLQALSKADLVEFYAHYISPQSTQRAKIAVHMVAQSSPSEIAKNTNPDEQKRSVLLLVGQFLNSQGIEMETEKVEARFADVDMTIDAGTSIVAAMTAYLRDDLKLEDAKVQDVVDAGQKVMGTVLPSLGINMDSITSGSPPSAEGTTNGATLDGSTTSASTTATTSSAMTPKASEGAAPAKQATTLIQDVHAYKAGLKASVGARPVKDLSEFEEAEPKL